MKFVMAFYEIDRAYGGSEEGGWWYDTGSLVRLHRTFRTEAGAQLAAARVNQHLDMVQRGRRRVDSLIYDGGRYRAQVCEGLPPRYYPEVRPHYE